ncbi:MAG: hypothetical protein JRE16_12485, partial [Deltaproteobacteria bacterium]|nr:hypothetical protein [Deltaproteobacteria bacterium]
MNQTAGKPVILLVLLCVALISGCAKEPVQVNKPQVARTGDIQGPVPVPPAKGVIQGFEAQRVIRGAQGGQRLGADTRGSR